MRSPRTFQSHNQQLLTIYNITRLINAEAQTTKWTSVGIDTAQTCTRFAAQLYSQRNSIHVAKQRKLRAKPLYVTERPICQGWQPTDAAFTAVSIFLFPLPGQCLHIVNYICIYTHTWLCTDHMNNRCYHITLQRNIFTQIGSGAGCWLDIYHMDAGLAVTGRIRDIGQNVLQSSVSNMQ